MLLARVRPYYMAPEYSDTFSICTGITPYEVERALRDVPTAEGVLITRPNYYGICCDIDKIAKIVHSYNKLLIVDEAHGPHLVFNKRLPVCALEAGADICIQSAHKTLPAFTQGAYLHIGSDRVDIERLEYFLDMFQTTSPSYIIMAFLDIARAIMQRQGTRLLDRLLDSIETQENAFCTRGVLLLVRSAIPGFDLDTTRLTVNVRHLGITGYDAETLLRQKYNIQVEMSDPANIVCICTAADNPVRIERLFSALEVLQQHPERVHGKTEKQCLKPEYALVNTESEVFRSLLNLYGRSGNNCRKFEPMDILNAETERTKLEDAAGKVSKGIIAPYPPGIALVCPSETITPETVDFLIHVLEAGGRVHGINNDRTVKVIANR
jgi:arginine decarboxylase